MESARKIRVGIVGLGRMGSYHLQKFLSLPDVDVAGVYDPHHGQVVAGKVPVFSQLAELLFESDAVVISSPTSTHAALAKQALESGVHVLVEKPIASRVEDAEALVKLARERGLVLQVGMVERFRMEALCGPRVLRPAVFVETHRLSPNLPREAGIDVIDDLMIHDLDLALSLVDEDPVFVSAIGMRVLTQQYDIANVRLEFANGTVMNLNASRISPEPVRKFRVFTDRFYGSFDFRDNTAAFVHLNEAQAVTREAREAPGFDPLLEQARSFVLCARLGTRPLVSGEDGLRALRFAKEVAQKIEERGNTLVSRRGPSEDAHA